MRKKPVPKKPKTGTPVPGWTYAQFKRDLLKVIHGKPPKKP